jgi:hypothetical protein
MVRETRTHPAQRPIAARHLEQPEGNLLVHADAYDCHHERSTRANLALIREQSIVRETYGETLRYTGATSCNVEGSIPAGLERA